MRNQCNCFMCWRVASHKRKCISMISALTFSVKITFGLLHNNSCAHIIKEATEKHDRDRSSENATKLVRQLELTREPAPVFGNRYHLDKYACQPKSFGIPAISSRSFYIERQYCARVMIRACAYMHLEQITNAIPKLHFDKLWMRSSNGQFVRGMMRNIAVRNLIRFLGRKPVTHKIIRKYCGSIRCLSHC